MRDVCAWPPLCPRAPRQRGPIGGCPGFLSLMMATAQAVCAGAVTGPSAALARVVAAPALFSNHRRRGGRLVDPFLSSRRHGHVRPLPRLIFLDVGGRAGRLLDPFESSRQRGHARVAAPVAALLTLDAEDVCGGTPSSLFLWQAVEPAPFGVVAPAAFFGGQVLLLCRGRGFGPPPRTGLAPPPLLAPCAPWRSPPAACTHIGGCPGFFFFNQARTTAAESYTSPPWRRPRSAARARARAYTHLAHTPYDG